MNRSHDAQRRSEVLSRLRASWRAWLLWAVVLVLLLLDWHASTPHRRFDEPMPLALGSGPAADAGHCSLAPAR